MTNLTVLDLGRNNISDLTPLENLTNPTVLYLWENLLSDLTPLENLTNLTRLYLWGNNISDLTPLENLTNSTVLNLWGNLLSDLTPLENLTNLTELIFSGNLLSDLTPLENLTNLTWLSLSSNRPLDLSPLTSLTQLTVRCNNVNIPRKYWVPVEEWSCRWILTEPNAEVRRFFIQIFGYERIAQELSAIELDSWREYSLLGIDMTIGEEDIYLLKMTCPSTGYVHMLRVPPDVNSAIEGITWVNWGISPEEFAIET